MITHIIVILIALMLEAFFSGTETALISCNKIRLRHRMEKGNRTAKLIWNMLQNPHRILATTSVGSNLCVVTGSIFAAHLFIKYFGEEGPLISTCIMTPLVLIFGEILPKSFARTHTGKIVYINAPILLIFQKIFLPVVIFIETLSGFIIKMLGVKYKKKSHFMTKEDIELLVRQITSEGVLERSEQGAIHQIFDFHYTRVGDIMIRLHDVRIIDYNDSRDKIIEKARNFKYTRYPVLDNRQIKGVLNIFDIFYNEGDWRKYIRPLKQVYANQRINRVLYTMQRNKDLLSAVVRKGKFIGIISLEDIIEEIELV